MKDDLGDVRPVARTDFAEDSFPDVCVRESLSLALGDEERSETHRLHRRRSSISRRRRLGGNRSREVGPACEIVSEVVESERNETHLMRQNICGWTGLANAKERARKDARRGAAS